MRASMTSCALAAALISGCSASSQIVIPPSTAAPSSTTSAVSSAPSSTSVPTVRPPALWSLPVARRNYAAQTKHRDALIVEYNKSANPPVLTQLKSLCKALTAADELLAGQVRAGRWPQSVRQPMNHLATALLKESKGWAACGSATTTATAAAATFGVHSAAVQAKAVRIALGETVGVAPIGTSTKHPRRRSQFPTS